MYCCIDESSDEPIMLIDKQIGDNGDGKPYIDGSLFLNTLLQLDGLGKKRIQVWICSEGGIVMDGQKIYAGMLKTKTKVDTYCLGICASIAAVIFQAGRNRIMIDSGLLMYHDPYGGEDKSLKPIADSIATMIASRTGHKEAAIKSIMAKTTWINAEEALDTGFCDSVENSADHNKRRVTNSLLKDGIEGAFKEARLILNSLVVEATPDTKIKTKNPNMELTLIANYLDLAEGTSEAKILNAIKKKDSDHEKELSDSKKAKKEAVDKSEDSESKLDKAKKELDAHKEEHDKLKAEYDKLKKETSDKMASDKKVKDDADAEDCKNFLNGAVTKKVLAADKVTVWQDRLKEGKMTLAEIKDAIGDLPGGKTVKATVLTPAKNAATETASLEDGIGSAMRDIKNKFYAGNGKVSHVK